MLLLQQTFPGCFSVLDGQENVDCQIKLVQSILDWEVMLIEPPTEFQEIVHFGPGMLVILMIRGNQ